ncbi:MAG: aspartate-semialdehyde dehydrogenase [Candidatus Kapabacteria bacterium]|nr:aspartate-semialdehyde dehydrogenase [Candidatus Kapabacteria bacterium]MDW8011829.1 aspartate-semialdehyde dehydrogenase [Bacteroidota bacterium]
MGFRIAVVGATGLVGRTILQVLQERRFPVRELRLFASERSVGQLLTFNGEQVPVESFAPERLRGMELSLWSAGSALSREHAWNVAALDCLVVDNSSAWRHDPRVPLVVPEVNPEDLAEHSGVIANPNCATIQLVVVLAPIARQWGLRRVAVATYQSISGAGQKGLDQLYAELAGMDPPHKVAPRGIAFTTAFHPIGADGWSEEERKIVAETRRILQLPTLPISATCVRLPTIGGHAEAVWAETSEPFTLPELRALLSQQPGVVLVDDPESHLYPHPRIVAGRDEVFVGRLRIDDSVPSGLCCWIVADNLRKGAATNAVQIAELLCGLRPVSPSHHEHEAAD